MHALMHARIRGQARGGLQSAKPSLDLVAPTEGGLPMRKRYIVALAALAAAFAVFGAAPAGANAPGLTASDLGKKVANFNIILHPNSWDQSDTTCQNNGSRIFFSADVTPWLLTWNFLTSANGFDI